MNKKLVKNNKSPKLVLGDLINYITSTRPMEQDSIWPNVAVIEGRQPSVCINIMSELQNNNVKYVH